MRNCLPNLIADRRSLCGSGSGDLTATGAGAAIGGGGGAPGAGGSPGGGGGIGAPRGGGGGGAKKATGLTLSNFMHHHYTWSHGR